MSELHQLQSAFHRAFFHPNEENQFVQLIQAKGKLTPKQRYQIYFDSISAGMASALAETYSACQQLVGEDFFRAMAYRYVEQTPSSSPNLFDYGLSFIDFVSQFEPAAEIPYLADVCRLEWAWTKAYYAAEDQYSDFSQLSHWSDAQQENVQFLLSPSASLIDSAYPLIDIWNLVKSADENTINLTGEGVKLLVRRYENDIQFERLSESQYLLLEQMLQRRKLVDIYLNLQDKVNVIEVLPSCIRDQWVIGFQLEKCF